MKKNKLVSALFFFVILNNTMGNSISFINRGSTKDYGFVKKESEQNSEVKKQEQTIFSSNKDSDIRNKIINFALKKLGSPYLWGASGTKEFDCSSFVQYVYKGAAGINLPRVSYQQAQFRPKITNVRKGDLLFFETLGKGRISHVGIYMGNGKFIHASSSYKQVVISDFLGFYKDTFRWAISVV